MVINGWREWLNRGNAPNVKERIGIKTKVVNNKPNTKMKYEALARVVEQVADEVNEVLSGSIYADELNNIAQKIREIPKLVKEAKKLKTK